MKKSISILLLMLLLNGCAAQISYEDGYVFTDDLGREVCVRSHERTAALLGSYADIWYLAGGTVCASADDAWEDFDLPLDENAVNLGGTKKLNLESLLASKPDLVLASTNTPQHVQWENTLEQAGITVAYFDVSDFGDYLRMLKICTEITEKPERYVQYGQSLQEQISQITERCKELPQMSVLVMRASAANIRAKNSNGTVLGAMLKDLGCKNIADSETSLLENLSLESIVLQDPDVIFFIQTGDDMQAVKTHVENTFQKNPLWQELCAVQKGNVFFMEKRLFNLKPNANWAHAYEILEEILREISKQ